MHWEARGCLALGDGRCLHLTGEGRQGRQETRERGRGWGSGDQALGRGLQNVSSTGSGSQHTCGLAERPPRLPAAARGAAVWGAGAWILLGSGSTRPHRGAGSQQPRPAPSLGPLCTSDETARPGVRDAARTHLRPEPGEGFVEGSGWPAPPPTWVWKPRGARFQPVSSASLGGGQTAPKR